MTSHGRRHLAVLTVFLIGAAVVTLVAILAGAAPVRPKLVVANAPVSFPAATTEPPAQTTTTTTTTSTSTTSTLPPTPKDVSQIRADVAPAVAFVTTFNGTGSGVLVDETLMVTNAHVVWPFATVGVLFPGDSRRTGRVVGIDPRADLALIEVESPRLPAPVELGSALSLVSGAQLYIVGYPGVLEFTPDPTVAEGSFASIRPWAFSGADWVTTDAPAVGGQSGGALLDEFGRLVGVTTFGSPATLYSLSVEDIRGRIAALRSDELPDLSDRLPPRSGGRLSHDLTLEGPWEQAAFVTWLSVGAQSELTSSTDVVWRALDPFGFELDVGAGSLDVVWGAATPGVVLGTASRPIETTVEATRPLVRLLDADDGRSMELGKELAGFIDVPGDRDWFYITLDEPANTLTVVVEAQTRVQITLHDRTTLERLADVEHTRGFFFEDPSLVLEDLGAGRYVVAVEDIGAQFGTYRIVVS